MEVNLFIINYKNVKSNWILFAEARTCCLFSTTILNSKVKKNNFTSLFFYQKRYLSYLDMFTNFYIKLVNFEYFFLDNLISINTWVITFFDISLIFNNKDLVILFDALKTDFFLSNDIYYDYKTLWKYWKNYYKNVWKAEDNFEYYMEWDNLPDDFFYDLYQKEMKFDRQIWDLSPNRANWFFGYWSHYGFSEYSYDETDYFPFFVNQAYIELFEDNMTWWWPPHIWQKSEMTTYYYDTLFYFIRDVSEWRSEDQVDLYDLTIFMLHWNFIFDDWLKGRDPFSFMYGEDKYKYFFPSFWWYQHKKLVKTLLAIYHRNVISQSWLLQSLDSPYFWRTIDVDDPSMFNSNKKFNYFWNLFYLDLGRPDNHEDYYMLGDYYTSLEPFINSLVLYQNKYVNAWNTYSTHWSKVLIMTIFPDYSFGQGYNNTANEYFTPDYHYAYYNAGTYMDSLELLEIWREQSNVVAGIDFEDFVTDYIVAAFIYFPDMSAFARCGLMYVANMPPDLLDDEAHFIRCFHSYLRYFNLNSEEFAKMTDKKKLKKLYKFWKPRHRLRFFWDDIDFDEWAIQSERWVGCMYGYNTSENLSNYPGWYANYTNTTVIYNIMPIDTQNETDLDNLETKLINYKHLGDHLKARTFLSEFISDWTSEDYSMLFNNYAKLISQNYFDEVGYFMSTLVPGEHLTVWDFIFSFLNFFPLLYSKMIPYMHLSWNYYYSLGWPIGIIIHDLLTEWSHKPYHVHFKEWYEWFTDFFIVDWDYTLSKIPNIVGQKNGFPVVAYSHNTHFDVYFSFLIRVDKILDLFIDSRKFLDSSFFYPLHCLLFHDWCLTEIMTEEDFFYYLSVIWNFLSSDWLYFNLNGNEYCLFYNIFIFDVPIKEYFFFFDKVLVSPEFIFIKNCFNYYITINHYRCGITVAGSDYFPYWIACLDFYDSSDWPFDLSFWLPFLIRPETDYLVFWPASIDQPLGVTFGWYFVDEEYTDEQYFMKYIYSLGQTEVVAFDLSLDNKKLNFLLDLTYNVQPAPKFIDFGWYFNYVLKETLYHPIPSKKIEKNNFIQFEFFVTKNLFDGYIFFLKKYINLSFTNVVLFAWNDFYLTETQIEFFINKVLKFEFLLDKNLENFWFKGIKEFINRLINFFKK